MFEQIPNILSKLKSIQQFSASDIFFSSFLCRLTNNFSDPNALIYALSAQQTGIGHVCIDLESDQLKNLLDETGLSDISIEDIKNTLQASGAVGTPEETLPIVFAGERFIYLKKFWDYQNIIKSFIDSEAISSKEEALKHIYDLLKNLIPHFFDIKTAHYDWQKGAAICAALNKFCVITGGPGTGKTTTAAKIIGILAEIIEKDLGRKPRVILAAPTGKAAARLYSSMTEALNKMGESGARVIKILSPAMTVHRLLGIGHASSEPRYNKETPIPADIVLLDEASMVDMAMMAKIMDALQRKTRFIIMGDKYQLSSVEPGSVLADICEAGPACKFSKKTFSFLSIDGSIPNIDPVDEEGFYDGVVELDRSYRFSEVSGIGILADVIKRGEKEAAIEIMGSRKYPDISWLKPEKKEDLKKIIESQILDEVLNLSLAETPEKALDLMDDFRVLCAVRDGEWGVEGLNSMIRELLFQKKRITFTGEWYHARPVMIKANDYQLGLFNGDTGIAYSDTKDAGLKVHFKSSEGGIKSFHPARLGAHETVYATTVHKSQGSEFNKVVLILPDKFTKPLSMELVYTAITRAKKEFVLIGSEETFKMAISERARRTSGLYHRLLGLI